MKPNKLIIAATAFALKFQMPWIIGTMGFGILFVLLPALSIGWRNEVAEWPKVYYIYEIFSDFKKFASVFFAMTSIPLIVAAIFGNSAYPGWNLKKDNRPTLSMVLQKKIYPTSWRGLAGFYAFLAIDLFSSLIPFIVICLISYFVKP